MVRAEECSLGKEGGDWQGAGLYLNDSERDPVVVQQVGQHLGQVGGTAHRQGRGVVEQLEPEAEKERGEAKMMSWMSI